MASITGPSVNGLSGVSAQELKAVLEHEYVRIIHEPMARIHPLAEQWNTQENNRVPINAENPFGRTNGFRHNFINAFPDLANRIQREMPLGIDTHAPDYAEVNKPPDPVRALEFQLNEFLDQHNDIDMWFSDLSLRLGLTNVETLEVALRMAMEITYKEEEAKISGLNRKLKAMETSEGE